MMVKKEKEEKVKRKTSFLAGSLFFLFLSCNPGKKYIAVVNGENISRDEFEKIFSLSENYYSQMLQRSKDDPSFQQMMAQVRKQLIESLIIQKLLLQEAKRRNIKATDEEVNAHIEGIKKKFGEIDYQNALRQQGLTEEEYKSELSKDITIEKLKKELTKDIKTTEEEAQNYYQAHPDKFTDPESVKARHILLRTYEEAKKVQNLLKKGEDFARLAKEFSIDPGTRDKGGDLGYFTRGKMVKEFEDEAFALKKGEISRIIKTQFGYHIIKVEDRKGAEKKSFEEVKEEIISLLTKEKENESFRKLISELRNNAKVKIYE